VNFLVLLAAGLALCYGESIDLTWVLARSNYLRGCFIKLRSMIRVRCLWLRPDIIAEGVAREGGSTRSSYLDMCALVSKEPTAGLYHCPIP